MSKSRLLKSGKNLILTFFGDLLHPVSFLLHPIHYLMKENLCEKKGFLSHKTCFNFISFCLKLAYSEPLLRFTEHGTGMY